jgi:transcriptional regulator with XRE-family HTH domain
VAVATSIAGREINKRFGQSLARWRKRAGISQEKLAEVLGLTRTSVTNIECGRQPIQLHTLYAIADALGIEPTDLMPAVSKLTPQTPIEHAHFKSLSVKTSHWLAKLSGDMPTNDREDENESGSNSQEG